MNKSGIYKNMLRVAVIPVLLFGIIITGFCYYRFKNTLYKQTKENMSELAKAVSLSYDIAYPGNYYLAPNQDDTYDLYKGDSDITFFYTIVDTYGYKADTEISLLYQDIRVNTTFKEGSKRLAGVCANAETSEAVLNRGEDVFYKNVPILSDDYLVYYTPLKNVDGSIIGMIEVAKRTTEIKKTVRKAVWPVLLLAVPGMIIAAFVSFRYTKEITKVLKEIQTFLGRIASGNLGAEISTECLARKDELGDISKSSVSMAKSIRASVETDPLTGLSNRRYVHSAVAKIAARSEMSGVPFAVAIADIDFFKKVNDTYGHNAGDDVLRAVAAQLKKTMMGNGFAARWGGEEFVLIFDRASMKDALPVLETLADNIRNMIVYSEGYEIKITMTMGITDGFGNDVEALVEQADAKLYYGKEHGRNQIVSEIPE